MRKKCSISIIHLDKAISPKTLHIKANSHKVGGVIKIRIMVGGQNQDHQTGNYLISNHSNKVGQLEKQMADKNSDSRQFSANIQTNPKEHYIAITTRSGKVISPDFDKNLAVEVEMLNEKKSEEEKIVYGETKDEGIVNSEQKKIDLPQLKSLPYPKNISKKDKERQYTRFMDIFKSLQINIPFMEDMEQMPTYAEFMKDLLTKKRKFFEETVTLEAGCSAIIQKFLPEKSKDPGRFTIPVTIGNYLWERHCSILGLSLGRGLLA
ncbi:hypothetical protein Lal_00024210 [Lupinus albus]|nr:hypothetical protein Lal_00024210 [Lupinus albus]